ncbi:Myb-like DNA-binding domain [Carpediemonas membranifera]|uniref:Myb-like DNA-binding domain n=1 Tax=Carpediemonas membranifera TaxID=201153 RepID=A0A8J6AVT7_9EUKA|nr:Myb-like DNA-binding domain [Carpediemonas membranifera]|eukprot:KAG9395458.1 Myb-like DNA-binding domain [Carpediemonas membranifera]
MEIIPGRPHVIPFISQFNPAPQGMSMLHDHFASDDAREEMHLIPSLKPKEEAPAPTSDQECMAIPNYVTRLAPLALSTAPTHEFAMPELPPPVQVPVARVADAPAPPEQSTKKQLKSNYPLMSSAEFAKTQIVRHKDSRRDKRSRRRLVWTKELHERFISSVGQLGIKSAVPKSILQLMNVEGITRENIASHLQKFRAFVRTANGLPEKVSLENYHLSPALLDQARKMDFNLKATGAVLV